MSTLDEDVLAARRASIHSKLKELGLDELRVVEAIADRLAMGQRQYGPLNIEGDPRSWRKEAGEEALDLSVYQACDLLRERARER